MEREILRYTSDGYRDMVHEGIFEITDDINIGDYILTHHVCRMSGERIMKKVIDKKVAYYFQSEDNPIYDLIVEGGSSYKSNLKHVSVYDSLIRTIPRDETYSHLYIN